MTHQKRKTLLAMDEESEFSEFIMTKHNYPIIEPVNPIEGVPFGLELLVKTKRLFIRPQGSYEENFMTLNDTNQLNHYDIIDLDQGNIYFAWENDVGGYGTQTLYNLKVVDFANRPVVSISNESTCLSSLLRIINCVGSTGGLVKVNSSNGTKIAQLVQKYNGWTPKFSLQIGFGKPELIIMGPKGSNCCCNQFGSSLLINAQFTILNQKGEQIGCITRGSPDPLEHTDTFDITFPEDIKVEYKVGLLSSVFAINSMFFDRPEFQPTAVEAYQEHVKETRRHERTESHKRDMKALGLDEDGKSIDEYE